MDSSGFSDEFNTFDLQDKYSLHHPFVGRVSRFTYNNFDDVFPDHSINWSASDAMGAPEIVTAETGRAILE